MSRPHVPMSSADSPPSTGRYFQSMTRHPEVQPPRVLLWGGRTKARLMATLIPKEYPDASVDVYEPGTIDGGLPAGVRSLRTYAEVAERWSTWTHFIAAIGGEQGYARVLVSDVLAGRGPAALTVLCGTRTRHGTARVDAGGSGSSQRRPR